MNVSQQTIPYKVVHVIPLIHYIPSTGPFRGLCHRREQSCSFSRNFVNQLKIHYFSHQITSKRWLCQSQDSILPENEYRSSRNIAISLFRRYRNFVERGGGDNLKELISAGVNAYSLGCTDEGSRKELTDMKESGVEIEAMQGFGGSTSLKSKIIYQEVDECILWLSIVFITILCMPRPTVAWWSFTPSVSEDILIQWKGSCAIIANTYYSLASCEDSPTGANGSNG